MSGMLGYALQPGHPGLLGRAALATLSQAALGYLVGLLTGTVLAGIGHLVRPLRRGLDRLNVTVHAIPVIALGPLFVLVLGQDRAPSALAALAVVFTIYIAVDAAFAAVPRSLDDLLTVLGTSRVRRLRILSVPAAAPALATALKLGLPRALIGAILGEWFGAPRGLGVLMLTAMQEARTPLLCDAVLIATLVSALALGIGEMLERWAVARYR